MITLLLWNIFGMLFAVAFVLTLFLYRMYSSSEVFIGKHPLVYKIYSGVVTATMAFFLAAMVSTVWEWI